jgi:hypothetical protein
MNFPKSLSLSSRVFPAVFFPEREICDIMKQIEIVTFHPEDESDLDLNAGLTLEYVPQSAIFQPQNFLVFNRSNRFYLVAS